MKKLAMLSVLLVASTCFAGTAALSMEVDTVNQTYSVYATVAGADTAGLDSFKFYVNFTGGVHASPTFFEEDPTTPYAGVMMAPTGMYKLTTTTTLAAGFSDNAAAENDGTSVYFMAGQPSVYSGGVGTKDAAVLKGVGMAPGSVSGTKWVPGTSWGAPVLLATGNYAGTNGTIGLSVPINQSQFKPSFTLLAKVGTTWVGPGNVMFADSVSVPAPLQIVPEPTTIGLLCLGLVGLIRRK